MYRIQQSTDFAAIQKLDKRIFPTDDPLEQNPNGTYWLLHHSGRKVGFCALHPLKYEPNICFMARSGILAAHHGRGLQRRMINVRLRHAQAEGFSHALTYAWIHNPPSISNLLKTGFRIYEPANAYAGEDMLYFIKDIRT